MEGVKFEIDRLKTGECVKQRADHGVMIITCELPDIKERGHSCSNVLQNIEPPHQTRCGAYRKQHCDPEGNAAETVEAIRTDSLCSKVNSPGPRLTVQYGLVHADSKGNCLCIIISAQGKGAFIHQDQPQKRKKGDKGVDKNALPEGIIFLLYTRKFHGHKRSRSY